MEMIFSVLKQIWHGNVSAFKIIGKLVLVLKLLMSLRVSHKYGILQLM